MLKTKQRILLVEDEINIAKIVREYLLKEGFEVLHEASGLKALEMINAQAFDLLLLDLMLPGLSGLEICKAVRQHSAVPIIMITARVDEIDRLIGLEMGADDYICKPFSPREVVARVKAVLRRHQHGFTDQKNEALLEIDAAAFVVRVKGQLLDLTPSEFKLLSSLAARPGHVLSRAQLLDALSDEKDVFDRTVDSHIKNLRKKLTPFFSDQEIIQTIYGVGYRFFIYP
jgi:two-component system response regulator BaeR